MRPAGRPATGPRASRTTREEGNEASGSTETGDSRRSEQQTNQQARAQTTTETIAQTAITNQTPAALSVEEEWETPATQQENALEIDPALLTVNAGPQATLSLAEEDTQLQTSSYPLEGVEGTTYQEADVWLENLANEMGNDWPFHPAGTEHSPPTSTATEPRKAQGELYKACTCPSHQEIYNNWPTQNAELTITKCMRTCMYCGKDFGFAAELRKHLKVRLQYNERNLTVRSSGGRWSKDEPGWTDTSPSSNTGPTTRQRESQPTRSQRRTDSTNPTSRS